MRDPEHGEVRVERDGAVALVTLDRPKKLNAMTSEMTSLLAGVVDELNADPGVRAVVVTGAGRAFCVGSDVGELDRYASAWEFGNRVDYGDVLRGLRKPAIAAVNGYAYGGGLELSLACDIRLCAGSASFAAPEIKLGWIGGAGQCALLTHAVGPGNAARLVLTGDPIDATTALGWGLVSEVHPDADLLDAARSLAYTIAARAPLAAEAAKIDLRATFEMPLHEAIALERRMQTICFQTDDAREGRAAFSERRAPRFQGK
ncbi:MAG: enoyl-CoA hydratase-related protein [Actinomycetota bacterium]|nr:enoyl-CoA hydratase-related protein [Actinomycetota bacterium]